MGTNPVPESALSCDRGLKSVMTQDVVPTTGLQSPSATPTTSSIHLGIRPQGKRGVIPDPKLGMKPHPSLYGTGDANENGVCSTPTHTYRPDADLAEQLGQVHSSCIEAEDSVSRLDSLGQLMEAEGTFLALPVLEPYFEQDLAGLKDPLAAESAAEKYWALAASSETSATAVDEPEAMAASSTVAAPAVEEPATPEGRSALTLQTTPTSSTADVLSGSPSLSSLTTAPPSPSSSALSLPQALPLFPILPSAADGLPILLAALVAAYLRWHHLAARGC